MHDRIRLLHMLESAERARRFCATREREDLDTDDMFRLALLKSIEIIGEAATKVSEDTRARLARIEWKGLRQMRNRTIHGYDSVNCDVVWKTVQEDLPPLIAELSSALASWPAGK